MGFETVLPHPLPSRFSAQSVQNTHIYTHCVNTLFGRRPRRVNRSMLGGAEDGGQTRADRGPGASTPPRTGRPGLALTSQHGPPGREGRFPSPRSSARDPQGVPYEWQGSLKGARAAPTPGPGIRPYPRPKMAPGRSLPRDCGGTGARSQRLGAGDVQGPGCAQVGRGGQPLGRTRCAPAHAALGEPARAGRPGHRAARPREQPPRPQDRGRGRGRAPAVTSAAAGGRVCREGAGAHKGPGGGGWGRGVSPARNRDPNEMQARFATQTRHILGKCKRHWQMQGKQAEFLLATK